MYPLVHPQLLPVDGHQWEPRYRVVFDLPASLLACRFDRDVLVVELVYSFLVSCLVRRRGHRLQSSGFPAHLVFGHHLDAVLDVLLP